MPIIYEYIPFLILFFSTFVVVLGLIPILSKVARKYGLVDNPDQHRKLHKNAIPLIGGISIFYGVILVYGILLLFFPTRILLEDTSPSDALQFIGLLVASILILVVGVIDDRFGIRGRQKLCFQILAALILVGSGTWISSVELLEPSWTIRIHGAKPPRNGSARNLTRSIKSMHPKTSKSPPALPVAT